MKLWYILNYYKYGIAMHDRLPVILTSMIISDPLQGLPKAVQPTKVPNLMGPASYFTLSGRFQDRFIQASTLESDNS